LCLRVCVRACYGSRTAVQLVAYLHIIRRLQLPGRRLSLWFCVGRDAAPLVRTCTRPTDYHRRFYLDRSDAKFRETSVRNTCTGCVRRLRLWVSTRDSRTSKRVVRSTSSTVRALCGKREQDIAYPANPSGRIGQNVSKRCFAGGFGNLRAVNVCRTSHETLAARRPSPECP